MTLHRKLLFAAFMIIVIARAWVCDDAYITMRVADNILDGYGPVWNIAERVQVFTHPLWLLILTVFYTVFDHYTTLLLPSVLCSAAVMWLLAKHSKTILPMVAAICCTSFVSFSTSGMENALSHLLLIVALLVWERVRPRSIEKYKKASLLFAFAWSAAILCRPDFFLLLSPVLGYLVWQTFAWNRSSETKPNWWPALPWRHILIGFSPVLIWGLFSLFYYGWPVPNTYFAKLAHGISQVELIKQGIMYLISSFAKDPLLVLIIFIGIAYKPRMFWPYRVGMILYLLYIVWIGGDFASSRLLTPLFAMSLMILGFTIRHKAKTLYIPLLIIFLLPLLKPDTNPKVGGVVSEELMFQDISALRHQDREGLQEKSLHGRAAREISEKYGECSVLEAGIGMFGFYLDKDVHVVDPLGLADPLLSHLPASDTLPWRIGHFKRDLPDGYERSVALGSNFIVDSSLHLYYDDIRLITRGDLWDWERIKTIVALNLGLRDHLVEEYVDRQKQ